MKSCPTCSRTYPDDTLAFCLIDGSVLSAAYDPDATQRAPARGGSNSTQTQILYPTTPNETAPTVQPTIRVAAPQVPSPYPPAFASVRSEERKNRAPWVIAGAAVLLAAVFGIVLLAFLWSGKSETANTKPSANVSSPIERQSNQACSRTLSTPIYDKWIEMGGENGRLKCPVENETEAPASPRGTTGRWVRFRAGDGGYLIWHESGAYAGKAFEVSGCMYKLYASQGGTSSWLGFPVSDGGEISTGVRQDFEAGYVLWDKKTYACQAHRN